jgi:hypothetical protein
MATTSNDGETAMAMRILWPNLPAQLVPVATEAVGPGSETEFREKFEDVTEEQWADAVVGGCPPRYIDKLRNCRIFVKYGVGYDDVDTSASANWASRSTGRVRLVVWLNEFFGPIVNAQGRPFEELPAYSDSKERISGLVRLPMISEEATSDLRDMMAKRMTFDQALARDNTSILRVQKSRLFRFKETVWPAIERVI